MPELPPIVADPELTRYLRALQDEVARLRKRVGGAESKTKVAASTARSSSNHLARLQTQTVAAEGAIVAAGSAPAAPTGITLASDVHWTPTGSARASITATWDAVTTTVDGEPIDVAGYELLVGAVNVAEAGALPGVVGADLQAATGTKATTATIDTLTTAGEYQVAVRAQSAAGVWGEPSGQVWVEVTLEAAPLAAPTAPAVASKLGVASVNWDGLLGGGAPGSQFRYVYALASATVDGTYATVGTPATRSGDIIVSGIPVGSTRFFKLVAVDSRGVHSAASPASTAHTITGVDLPDLGATVQDSLDAAVTDTVNEWASSASSTVAPTTGWSRYAPLWESGKYTWERTVVTHGGGASTTSEPVVITGANGQTGEDAVLLRVSSTRGTSFKNSAISTVLTVTVFKGTERITNITDLRAACGNSSYLEWWWRRIDDAAFGVISSADSRLSESGFALTVSPADVDEQSVFECRLHTS